MLCIEPALRKEFRESREFDDVREIHERQTGVQDCLVVLRAARDLEAQLAQVDKQARGVIDEIRKRHKERRAGSVLPPPPPELAQLQAERNSLVEAGAGALKQQLTSNGLKTLSNYLVKRQDGITPTSPKPILK